jgi:opacity protein-like surface antigen
VLQQLISAVSKMVLSNSCAGGCFILFLAFARLCAAQSEEPPVTFHVGGGLTAITGSDSGRLDKGGNLQAGAGHFFNRYFGIEGNFMWNQLGITGSELNRLGQPDGQARVYTVTVDPTLRFPLGRGFSAYVFVGGGYLRRTVEFTQPTLVATFVFDPWWGYVGPALVPASQILGSVSSNSGAVNGGGGLNIPIARKAHLFIEPRYVRGFTSNSKTTIVPITVGLRF